MSELSNRIAASGARSPYFEKDIRKASYCNKFIGRGNPWSSTGKYARAAGDLANCGVYSSDDVVMISSEGDRPGRTPPDADEIGRAAAAGAKFITDSKADRSRPYNVGEREVEGILRGLGYTNSGCFWRPGTGRKEIEEEEV